MAFQIIVGLEIHVELNTQSKIFCSCSTKFGVEPNENTCPICMGLPGTLPVLNEEVVNLAIGAGRALNCDIQQVNKTDRKNYFYPDLPKAYQISQFDMPLCTNGHVKINVGDKTKDIRLTRIHIEEDAGKLIHLEEEPISLVDYNRAGIPLIEIVSEPDIRSAQEAVAFLKTLKGILEYSEISDCKMAQGSLRCDVNISVREVGEETYNTKVEIKNLNSFKEVAKAINQEEKRQKELYLCGQGHKIKQETRKWDEAKGRTVPMRSKEDAHDYRYFPEPDLPPILISKEQVKKIEGLIPELPREKKRRFIKEYGLGEKEIEIIITEKRLADYFEKVVSLNCKPKAVSNWITVEMLRVLKNVEEIPVKAGSLAKLIQLVEQKVISRSAAKEVFDEMVHKDVDPEKIVRDKELIQMSDTKKLENIAADVIAQNPKAVEDFHNGKTRVIGFLVGQMMKVTKGKANPALAKGLLIKTIKHLSNPR